MEQVKTAAIQVRRRVEPTVRDVTPNPYCRVGCGLTTAHGYSEYTN
ncbi:hypothetical protein [Moorena sp. SIO4G3]|nr:hypothetical protein [Moorena sp. SIO4G3]NEO82484.1 hypothetical protein [Moorena sp. SIO4G3]